MAADFGALEEFIDDYDINFTFRGTEYKETFDFANIAAFKAYMAQYDKRVLEEKIEDAERIALPWVTVAILCGGKFDMKTWTFKNLPKGSFLTELIEAGAPYDVFDRLVTAIFIKYRYNDEVATSMYEHRNLGKAIQVAAEKIMGSDNQETPTEPGETNEDDSETSKD